MQTRRLNRLPPGRKRSAPAAIPELQAMKGLDLARWAAAARAGGLPLRSVAQLIGYTPRGLSKLLSVYATDPFVARDQAIGLALEWEQQGAAALQQATTDALAWLQTATSNPDTDAREVAAALSATIQSGHRLAEAGARCARRYTPETPQPQARFDLQGFLGQVAAAAAQVRALPAEQQPNAWEQLRTHCQQLGQQQLSESAEPDTTVTVSAIDEVADPLAKTKGAFEPDAQELGGNCRY